MTACLLFPILVVLELQAHPVCQADKSAYLKLLDSLPVSGEFYTAESIAKAAPYTPVLFSLTVRDAEVLAKQLGLKTNFEYAFASLTRGLSERKEQREYGVKHFGAIAHPQIKLFWAIVLFNEGSASPEVVNHLRQALASKEQNLATILGGEFGAFKKRVASYPLK